MKLKLNGAVPQGEAWRRENRERGIYPMPNDGREWMLMDEAAELFGVSRQWMSKIAQKLDFTRTCRRGVKAWVLKKDVMDRLAFLKDRARWYKRRQPKNWKPMMGSFAGETDEELSRFLWTTKQAAAFMGVSEATIHAWVRKGKIAVFHNRKVGKGGKHWFSPTSLRNYKEDETRLKWLAAREKAKATMQSGAVGREVYRQRHRARVYKNLPAGWLTIRQAAAFLGISHAAVGKLRRGGRILAKQLVGRWDAKNRPWFICQSSLEEYTQTDDYQRRHRQGLEAQQKVLGSFHTEDARAMPRQELCRDFTELASSPSYDELMQNREGLAGYVDSPSLWLHREGAEGVER